MDAATISAIASLWKLVVAITVPIVLFGFRDWFKKLTKVKLAGAEVIVAEPVKEVSRPEELPPATTEPSVRSDPPKQLAEPAAENSEAWNDFYDALTAKDVARVKETYQALQVAERDAADLLRGEVFYKGFLFTNDGDHAALGRLEQIAKDHPAVRTFALGWLGIIYRQVHSFDKAKDAFSRAMAVADAAGDQGDRAKWAIELARLHRREGDFSAAERLLVLAASWALSDPERSEVLRALASTYEEQENKLLEAVVLERAADFDPSDSRLRFSAAHAQSEAKLNHLAAASYATLLTLAAGSTNDPRNNLGVLAATFELPITSTGFYQEAAGAGSTLATANLAYKLLGEGFVTEARKILNEALAQPDVHPNVNEALADISKREEKEKEKWTKLLKVGESHQQFVREFVDIRLTNVPAANCFDGKWRAKDGTTFQVTESVGTSEVTIEWGPADGPATILSLSGPRFKFEGKRVNRSAIGTLKKWTKSFFSAAGSWDSGQPALAFCSENAGECFVLEVGSAADTDVHTFKRFTAAEGTA